MANLTYLFECHFNDGTFLAQTPEDVSATEPTKSAFYDVVQRIDEVAVFGVVNDQHTYAVDLRDGHFEVNGIPFNVQAEELPTRDCVFRLIYFRRNRVSVTLGVLGTDHSVEYHIGWQTTIDGKNYQQTMSVA